MDALELRQKMAALPEPVTDKQPPFWEHWRRQLWQLVTSGTDPAGFTGWPCIYHTMLVNHWPGPVAVEFDALPLSWWPVLATPPFEPADRFDGTSFSRNLIHQAYHLHRWQQATGRQVNALSSIVEFGGGYGAMALLCRRLGFRGRYMIYDLPEFALLQQWFLSQMDIDAEWLDRPVPHQPDLLIGLYSLSETPLVQRAEFLRNVKAGSYLFLYSGNWQHYDNVAYFRGLEHLAANWRHTELEHLPDRDNWYSIGWNDANS